MKYLHKRFKYKYFRKQKKLINLQTIYIFYLKLKYTKKVLFWKLTCIFKEIIIKLNNLPRKREYFEFQFLKISTKGEFLQIFLKTTKAVYNLHFLNLDFQFFY